MQEREIVERASINAAARTARATDASAGELIAKQKSKSGNKKTPRMTGSIYRVGPAGFEPATNAL